MKSNVLFLISLPPPNIGPALISREILNSEKLRNDFTIEWIAVNTSETLKRVEHFSFAKLPKLCIKLARLIAKLVKKRFAFAYFTLSPAGIGFFKDFAFVCILKLFRVKLLYHLHGKGVSRANNPFVKFCYKFCFNKSKAILTSAMLAADVKEYLQGQDIYYLANGIREVFTESSFSRVMTKRNSFSGPSRLLYLGNMVSSKGVFTALEAARILKTKGENFRFYFAGGWFDIREKDFINYISINGLENSIEYLGFKSGAGKLDTLINADIFVFPTFKDTFPLVLLEAMQFGLPVVSTIEGAIPEIVDDSVTGFLVSKKDPEALAQRISALMHSDQLRFKMGENGRMKFLRQYTFSIFENKLNDIFHQALGGSKCAE